MLGTCALCLKASDLQNSHLIPAWAYRRVLEVDALKSPAPVLVEAGSAVMVNKEMRKHLLCSTCEKLFSEPEQYVKRITEPGRAGIALLDLIERRGVGHQAIRLPSSVDARQIGYFAASVLWRSCVMTGECALGPYQDAFRTYLLGETQFPSQAVMNMAVFEPATHSAFNAEGVVTLPASVKPAMFWVHGFMVAGLAFRCLIGKTINPQFQRISLCGPDHDKYALLLLPEQSQDFLAAVGVAAASVPRGKRLLRLSGRER